MKNNLHVNVSVETKIVRMSFKADVQVNKKRNQDMHKLKKIISVFHEKFLFGNMWFFSIKLNFQCFFR